MWVSLTSVLRDSLYAGCTKGILKKQNSGTLPFLVKFLALFNKLSLDRQKIACTDFLLL